MASRGAAAAAAAVARAVGAVLRGPVRRWRSYWDVDHVAGDFRTPEEQAEWVARARASNEKLEREMMQVYAVRHILPRLLGGQREAAAAAGPPPPGGGRGREEEQEQARSGL
jgi:hypothetical protein